MRCLTTQELSEPAVEICQRVQAGEEIAVTREGKTIALVVRTDAQALVGQLRALRLSRFGEAARRLQAHAAEAGADQLAGQEIQAEIDAVRRDAAATEAGSGRTANR